MESVLVFNKVSIIIITVIMKWINSAKPLISKCYTDHLWCSPFKRADFHHSTAEWSADPLGVFVIPNLERWVRLSEGTDSSPSAEAGNGFSETSVGAEQVKSQSS